MALLLLCGALLYSSSNAQTTRVISGIVYDESHQPIEAATVRTKGGNSSTRTDSDGKFTLKIADGQKLLVISFVSMKTIEMPIPIDNSSIVINMETSGAQLEDVVITGFQTLPRERATGSFGSVSKDQLSKPSTNISQRLIGSVAGVQAVSIDVDGNPTLRIRGLNTLNTVNAYQEPLVVVDGFPIQGSYSSINPNDVETITVLKDAAAASIWGARAGNGVIVITTKKAAKGTPLKVDFSSFVRVGDKMDVDYIRPLATTAETLDFESMVFNKYGGFQNNALLSASGNQQWLWTEGMNALNEHFLGKISLAARDSIRNRLRSLDNRQQIKDLLLANPVNQQYNLSLSSSTTRFSQVVSLLYEANQGDFKGNSSKRYMFNYRATANITKWLDLNLMGMYQQNKITTNGITLDEIKRMAPYEMLLNEDGSHKSTTLKYNQPILNRMIPTNLFPNSNWTYNPVSEINSRDYQRREQNLRAQAGLRIKPMKGLSFESRIQYENFQYGTFNYNNPNSFAARDLVNTTSAWNPATPNVAAIQNLPSGGFLDQNLEKVLTWNWRNMLQFDREFGGRHQVNFVAGTEQFNANTQITRYSRTFGYNDATLQVGNFFNGPGGTVRNGAQNGTQPNTNLAIKNWLNQNQTFAYTNIYGYSTDRFFSAFGNLAYTLDDKYTVSGSVRSDASNIITEDPKYRYAPFWSVGASWQLWRESFMQSATWINRLALRATFGYNGNIDKTTAAQPTIFLSSTPDVNTGQYMGGFSGLGNPTLRWEKNKTINLGLDYALFNGKLFGKVDVYSKTASDLIASIAIPVVNGTTTQRFNNAEMENKGIEIELGTTLYITKNLTWTGNINFSYNRNRITNLYLTQYIASNLTSRNSLSWVEGENANTLWMYKYLGFNAQGQPTVLGPEGQPFDMQRAIAGDGRTFMQNMGTTVAPYSLGFMNNFNYKDFSLSFIITGNFGHVFQRTGFNFPSQASTALLPNKFVNEALTAKDNEMLTMPKNINEPRYFYWSNFANNLSYLVENASWVRLQEVNITYRLPRKLISKAGFGNAMIFVQGNDLLTITANKYKEDPLYLLGTMNPRPKGTFGIRFDF